MSTLIVEHGTDGSIKEWRYEPEDDHTAGDGEISVDPDTVDHRELHKKRVDLTTDPPTIVDDPEWSPTPSKEELGSRIDEVGAAVQGLENGRPVQRAKVTDSAKQSFRDARDAGDVQAQLDILFEIVTGEEP